MSKRNAPEFEALVRVVSEEYNCPPQLVEKDYWIALILSRLVSKFGDLIIFKGGTSLAKAWGLINRFSEDVDVLLDSSKCKSKSQQRKQISEFRKFLETSPGLKYLPQSKQGDDHGSLRFGYESVFEGFEGSEQNVLVEVGFRGGTEPTELIVINSMIGESLTKHGKDTGEYKPFQIRVLHPKRTLIEKLFALAAAYKDGNLPQKTRHYYDAFCLLNNRDLNQFVGSPEFFELVDDVGKHTLKNFGSAEDITTLLNSPAYALSDTEYKAVSNGYMKDDHLYFAEQPPFKSVYQVVRQAVQRVQQTVSL